VRVVELEGQEAGAGVHDVQAQQLVYDLEHLDALQLVLHEVFYKFRLYRLERS